MNKKKGILYLVSTPIGNLEDITFRALRILKEADLIAAEDTRHTRKLLTHYGVNTQTTSFYSQNQKSKTPKLIEMIINGKNIALVSDAGTPGISDPGFEIICEAIKNDIAIIPIPGPTALIAGLTCSGFPSNKFVYEGFLSSKAQTRRKELNRLKNELRTIVLYESPHRIKHLLNDIISVFGDRKIVLGRELTKCFEEFLRGTVSEIRDKLPEKTKGEFTVVIEGCEPVKSSEKISEEDIRKEIQELVNCEKITKNEAIKKMAKLTGIPKNKIYKTLLGNN